MPMKRFAVGALFALLGGLLAACADVPSSSHLAGPVEPAVPACRANHLRLVVVLTGSTMSQPFADVAVTNTGATSCVLTGYPRIRAWGHRGWHTTKPAIRLGILVHHGIYERIDRGPRPVILHSHRQAFFSVGTEAAYQGGSHPIILTRLRVTLPDTQSAKTLRIDLLATRPPGRRVPVGVTAVRRIEKAVG